MTSFRPALPLHILAAEPDSALWAWALADRDALRAVDRLVHRYQHHADPEDLWQAGLIGLLHAARRFEPSRGVRFVTYARWWIRAEMTRLLKRSRPLSLSERQIERLRCLALLRREKGWSGALNAQARREAAAALGLTPPTLDQLLVLELLCFQRDDPKDADAPPDWLRLRDPDALSEEDLNALLDDAVYQERLRAALLTLEAQDPRVAFVVMGRFGLANGAPRSFAELGAVLDLSVERTRQLLHAGLAALAPLLRASEVEQ